MSSNPDRTFLTDFDFLSSAALAVAITGLAIGWFAQSADSSYERANRVEMEDHFTLTEDGRMKLTITAQRPKEMQAAVAAKAPS
jgi:hypothetical protein